MAGSCPGAADTGVGHTGASACVHVTDEGTGEEGGACLPIAPVKDRVDLAERRFTPHSQHEPLHPTSDVTQ